MKEKIVRVCAWFTIIFFSLTSLVSFLMIFTEKSKIAIIGTFLILLGMSITGFYTRKFGLPSFKLYRFSKPLAIFTLIIGTLFVILAPIIFTKVSGFRSSFKAIITLLIMFLPVVVTSVAILASNSTKKTESESVAE